MSINIWTDSMQHAALLGKPVLFTNWLIQRDIIPDGWYCYDLRGTHKSPSTRTTLVDHAADYHAGTVLSPIPLKHEGTASRRVNGTFYLLGEEMTLEQFCEEHDLAYPQDNREFVLRPASLDEVGLFYSEEKLDEALGTVGHLRMDFGHGEKEFWHTWWPHNEDRFNTPEFKEVLQRFVDDLRQTGLLKNLGAMDAYCWQHGGSITEDRRSYGYIAETENYRFCLRCTPFPGEYQGYLYCYDLCQQEMYRQEHPVVGRVTFASGEQQEFTDSKALLQAIREELPFRSTTGFRFETLTDDPEVKKAVDDILLDFAGEDNSRRPCNYGLTETGKQALRKAADPSIPHTYAWFVMTDTNTPQEIIRQDLTLEEAIQIYQDSNTSEKRLGVIKDGIATVDFVHFQSGEQQFFTDHEKLESFRSDLVVAEAMERLYQQLNQPDMRDCLLAKELTAGDKVLFVATEPYGGPGDFDLRGGVIESVDEKDKTCSVRGTFFTMEKVPLHYVLGRYNPAVGEEHYGVRGIVPFFCEDKELAGYYLNEVRIMWDVEMGEEQDLSM